MFVYLGNGYSSVSIPFRSINIRSSLLSSGKINRNTGFASMSMSMMKSNIEYIHSIPYAQLAQPLCDQSRVGHVISSVSSVFILLLPQTLVALG